MRPAELLCVALAMAAVAVWVRPSPRRLLARRQVVSRKVKDRWARGRQPDGPVLQSGQVAQPSARLRWSTDPSVSVARTATSSRRRERTSPPSLAVGQLLARAVIGRWHARGAADRRRREVIELLTAIGTELRAGAMPTEALVTAVAAVPGLCDEVGRGVVLGGDAVSGLRQAAVRPGAEGLSRLAAAWTVTELTGTGLADGCERVGGWLRDEEALRREIGAQLAGARASARLLTVLPLFGLALGTGIGGDPIGFLLGTSYGLGCLVAGTGLVLAGLLWTERLATSVEAQI